MSRKNSRWPKIVGLLFLSFVFAVGLAQAQQEAHLYLQPVDSSEEGVLLFDVMVENVTEMYGAEFRLSYDPTALAVQDLNANQEGLQIEPGTLLPVNSGFVVANKVDEQAGVVTFAMTLLNPAPAANGSGPLARVAFKVLGGSPSTIEIAHAKLVAIDLQTLPYQASGFTVSPEAVGDGGNSSTLAVGGGEAAFPATFPWWIVAAAILILGTLALGSLIMWGSPRRLQTSGAGGPPGPVRHPYVSESPRPGSRPSAFKQQSFSADKPHRQE